MDLRALGGGYKGTGHSEAGVIYTPYSALILSSTKKMVDK